MNCNHCKTNNNCPGFDFCPHIKIKPQRVKVGAKVLIKEKGARKAMDNHSSRGKRKCYRGTIMRVNGGYIYVRPYWTTWELELYDCEIKVL